MTFSGHKMNIGKLNIWFGWIPFTHLKAYPRFSFFNCGKYWKFGIYWFKYLLEFSGPKKDKTVYKKVTSEELDRIIEKVK